MQSDQYTMDPEGGMFFIRIEFDLELLQERLEELGSSFAAVAQGFRMEWKLTTAAKKKRIAVFVSKEDHCLLELLWQWQAGDLNADIAMVVSNHQDMRDIVESMGIPFHYIPVTADTKAEAERRQLEIIDESID